MAFTVGSGRRGPHGEINVTPLIDIVLVLLIIFMVMTPVMLKELVAKVPQKQTENVPQPPGDNPIVVELDKHDTLTLNVTDNTAAGGATTLSAFSALADGGQGTNTCTATPNVLVQNG